MRTCKSLVWTFGASSFAQIWIEIYDKIHLYEIIIYDSTFQPTHPGEALKDELEYRGISQRGLAKEIGISYSAFNEMLNGKRPLSPELAMMMEAILGVDAAPLLAMQNE